MLESKDHLGHSFIPCHYIDNILIKIVCNIDADQLKCGLKEFSRLVSGLNFTIVHSVNDTMPFFKVFLQQQQFKFTIAMYMKLSNLGHYCNGMSECPE